MSCDSDNVILPCIATVFFIDNLKVSLQQTSILYSRHIGLFTMKNQLMFIVGSSMAYSNINCIIILLYCVNGSRSMEIQYESSVISDSHFLFGQAMNIHDLLASGLNLLFLADSELIHGTVYDRAYLYVRVQHTSFVNNKGQYGNFFAVFELSILLVYVDIDFKNLSVVSDDNFPGLVIHEYCTLSHDSNIYINLVECTLVGSCVVIEVNSNTIDYGT